MKRLLLVVLASLCLPAIAQTHRHQVSAIAAMQSGLVTPTPTTWYVRKDGGTRKTCDGKADAAPVGSALNQHCALGDYRFLYDDQSGKPLKWVMAGGDKVILKDGPWRVGFNQGSSSNDVWGRTGLGPQASEAPPIPAGTAAMHTQILGGNFASCSSTNKTQLFGGFGLYHVLSLAATSFVDVECIELTRHSQCIQHGDPAVPAGCSRDFPFDDYSVEGVVTDQGTHDVLMQDMWIHGFPDRGVLGAIGGTVTCLRCDIAYNGMAGWDFDDGTGQEGTNHPFGTPSIKNAKWNFLYSTIEYSGCNQAYPGPGAISCYGQSNGGYGDGMGAPPGTALNINVDHSTSRYNTQDGMDPGHIDTGSSTLSVTDSAFYGNGGGQLKWGYNFASATITGNTFIGNCLRMAAPLADNAAAYNAHLGDFCRAGSTLSWNYRDGQTVNFSSNTIASYGPLLFTLGCSTPGGCPNAHTTFQKNVILGYDNPATYNLGGSGGGPSFLYCQDNTNVVNGGAQQMDCGKLGVFTRASNVFFGVRGVTCLATEKCADPLFVAEPKGNGANFTPAELDGFNTALQSRSPATGLGAAPQIVGTASTVVTAPRAVLTATTPKGTAPPEVTPPPAVTPPAQTGTWFTVIPAEKQAQTLSVSVPAGTAYRFGDTKNNKWCTPVTVSTATTVSDWDAGPEDCDPGTAKEMDILETSAPRTVTLIDSSVTRAILTPKTVPAVGSSLPRRSTPAPQLSR
jgi:hypothetical protein